MSWIVEIAREVGLKRFRFQVGVPSSKNGKGYQPGFWGAPAKCTTGGSATWWHDSASGRSYSWHAAIGWQYVAVDFRQSKISGQNHSGRGSQQYDFYGDKRI